MQKRKPFRDHRHRGENALKMFGTSGKEAYLKIAKSTDKIKRDKMIAHQNEKFQTWLMSVDIEL